jgi:hypothetical protein
MSSKLRGGFGMSSAADQPVVAIFNSNDIALFRLRRAFEAAGYCIVTAHAARFDHDDDLHTFLTEAAAEAVVYDFAPPYSGQVTTFAQLYAAARRDDRPFEIASTERTGTSGEAMAVAVIGHRGLSVAFEAIVEAVRHALAAPAASSITA